MAKFRKLPVVVDAIQFTGQTEPIREFVNMEACNNSGFINFELNAEGDCIAVLIPTLEGTMRATIGDWIIKGVKGEFYSCKPDIFVWTYVQID